MTTGFWFRQLGFGFPQLLLSLVPKCFWGFQRGFGLHNYYFSWFQSALRVPKGVLVCTTATFLLVFHNQCLSSEVVCWFRSGVLVPKRRDERGPETGSESEWAAAGEL